MTTYSRTFEVTLSDLNILKRMVYREEWTQSIFERLTLAQPLKRKREKSEATVEITMRDLESIPFEYWLDGDTLIGTATPPQDENEQACKTRVALAYKSEEPELSSWRDFGDAAGETFQGETAWRLHTFVMESRTNLYMIIVSSKG